MKLNLTKIKPLRDAQEDTFHFYNKGYNLILEGSPGTGKTFISSFLGLQDVQDKSKSQDKVIFVRSCVASRDMGYLPGSQQEKMAVYEMPYKQICGELYRNNDSYEILKGKNLANFISTSFIRGITMSNAVIIVDEVQNLSIDEINTIITRLGENSRIIFCGDTKQCDFGVGGKKKEESGLGKLIQITKKMPSFKHIEFGHSDIVRSEIVKDWIIAKDNLGL